MDYERMVKIYNYVYSTPKNSPEREARLAELSEADSAALYDFDIGLMSGRIKKPENQTKKSEVCTMNKTRKIESYEDFKKALVKSGTYQMLVEFKRSNPSLYEYYQQRLEKEKAR